MGTHCEEIEMENKELRDQNTMDTDRKYVSVEDVLDTIRDMAHHPGHIFRAQALLDELEHRLLMH